MTARHRTPQDALDDREADLAAKRASSARRYRTLTDQEYRDLLDRNTQNKTDRRAREQAKRFDEARHLYRVLRRAGYSNHAIRIHAGVDHRFIKRLAGNLAPGQFMRRGPVQRLADLVLRSNLTRSTTTQRHSTTTAQRGHR